jgi:hypothetical protein
MPVGNIPGWRQVFADNFVDGKVPLGGFSGCSPKRRSLRRDTCSGLRRTRYYHKWWAYPDGWSDGSGGTYYPSRVMSIEHGRMNLYIHSATIRGTTYHLVAAPVPLIPGATKGGGLLYGRYVVRFRSSALHGYKTAWLLWPDSGVWPRDGEIDFPEGDLDGSMNAFIHWQGPNFTASSQRFATKVTDNAWHTATLVWTRHACRFVLDGKAIGTAYMHIPKNPMHWVLQTQTATDGTIPGAATAGTVQIDWVAVYVPA